MTARLDVMCRTALTFAPIWGETWALGYIRAAVTGDTTPLTWERGRKANRRASLGARVVELRERIRRTIQKLGDPAPLQSELVAVEKEWQTMTMWEKRCDDSWRKTAGVGPTVLRCEGKP